MNDSGTMSDSVRSFDYEGTRSQLLRARKIVIAPVPQE